MAFAITRASRCLHEGKERNRLACEIRDTLAQGLAAITMQLETAFDTDERIIGAIRAGAQGYLLKGAPREELCPPGAQRAEVAITL